MLGTQHAHVEKTYIQISTPHLPQSYTHKKCVRNEVFWANVSWAQQVRALAKSDILSLILRTYMIAEEN